MKIITPEEMENSLLEVDEAIEKFNKVLTKEDKGERTYLLVILKEYSRKTCDEIERLFLEAGWAGAICKTSTENKERPGLTGLRLYRFKSDIPSDITSKQKINVGDKIFDKRSGSLSTFTVKRVDKFGIYDQFGFYRLFEDCERVEDTYPHDKNLLHPRLKSEREE